jgi:hypothetical protein
MPSTAGVQAQVKRGSGLCPGDGKQHTPDQTWADAGIYSWRMICLLHTEIDSETVAVAMQGPPAQARDYQRHTGR